MSCSREAARAEPTCQRHAPWRAHLERRMKITEATTYIVGNPWKNWVFLRLETDEGIHGIGEATLNAFARTTATAIEELGPMYLGMDPFRIETIVQQMSRDVYSDGGQIHGCA